MPATRESQPTQTPPFAGYHNEEISQKTLPVSE